MTEELLLVKQDDMNEVSELVIAETTKKLCSIKDIKFVELYLETEIPNKDLFDIYICGGRVKVTCDVTIRSVAILCIYLTFSSDYGTIIRFSEIQFSKVINDSLKVVREQNINNISLECRSIRLYGNCSNIFSNLRLQSLALPTITNASLGETPEPFILDSCLENTHIDSLGHDSGNFNYTKASSYKDIFKNFTIDSELSLTFNFSLSVCGHTEIQDICIDIYEFMNNEEAVRAGITNQLPHIMFFRIYETELFKVDNVKLPYLQQFLKKGIFKYLKDSTDSELTDTELRPLYQYINYLFKENLIENSFESFESYKKEVITQNLFKSYNNDINILDNLDKVGTRIYKIIRTDSKDNSVLKYYEVPIDADKCHETAKFSVCFKLQSREIMEYTIIPYLFIFKDLETSIIVYDVKYLGEEF